MQYNVIVCFSWNIFNINGQFRVQIIILINFGVPFKILYAIMQFERKYGFWQEKLVKLQKT